MNFFINTKRTRKKLTIILTLLLVNYTFVTHAQVTEKKDSLNSSLLNTINVDGLHQNYFLPDVKGVNIFAGKKTNLIQPNDGEANLAQNVTRMIFAKTPGINMWDMDGAGTQVNIGSRGTDAHRSIEMNMRQNGANTNSDIFGYPENHYSVPMQGVKEIQLVRGSAALQFGPQFGGMMNYVMKEGDSTKKFSLESEQTTGSYNFFNSYNAIGGKTGKVSYYAYYDNRHGDGWRPNAAFNYQAYYANLKYQFSSKGSLSFQFSHMDYRQQIAGGLTDAQFYANARQSNRARNFFNPTITLPAIVLNYNLSGQTHLQVTANGIAGQRNSVQYIRTPDIADTIAAKTKSYSPRQVDRDYYKGITLETRLLHHYQIGGIRSTLATGFRLYDQRTLRKQLGQGTAGSNFDLSLVAPYGVDLTFHTTNFAAFAENVFRFGDRLSVTPGVRYELINSNLTGVITNATVPVSYKGNRSFPLFGTGVQYQATGSTQFYGNITQAYRPYLYASITPSDIVGKIDPNLKDSKGYDVDLGYRGQLSNFVNFDANVFYLFYGNKIGKLTETNADKSTYQLTTNIGNSVAKGFELYMNVSLWKLAGGNPRHADIRVFTSTAYTRARYVTGSLGAGAENISLVGNHVENVPDWIVRSGVEFQYRGFTTRLQSSHTSKQFSDANNTVLNSTGVVGVIPSYTLYDCSLNYQFLQQYHIAAGVNNIANAKYFSRRINMYPGPGILPGDGRTFYISLGLRI